jgi:lysophospholipase L1-like esterase
VDYPRVLTRLGFLGDSIMASNHSFSGTDGGFTTAQAIGEINWASALYPHFEYDTWYASGASPNFEGMNTARGGDTSTLTLGRVAALNAYSPGVVLVAVGTNDVTNSTPAATAMANIEAICQYFLSRGKKVILATVRPRGGAAFPENLPDGDPRLVILQDLNTLIRAYAAATANVYLWDVYLAYDDGTGRNIAGYTIDGTHPTRTGAQAGGASLVPVLEQVFSTDYSYAPTAFVPLNGQQREQMLGTGGGGTLRSSGTTATGWFIQASGTGTATCVKSKDGNDKQVMTITPQASGAANETFIVIPNGGALAVVPGNWYKSYIKIRLSAWGGWRALQIGGGGMLSSGLGGVDAAAVLDAPTEVELDIIGPPWQCPVGTTTQPAFFRLDIDGTASGSGVATVETYGLAEIPDPRPLHGVSI